MSRIPERATGNEFYWLPVKQQRHAIHGNGTEHHAGDLAETLCAKWVEVPALVTDLEWITWRTCDQCWDQARMVSRRT